LTRNGLYFISSPVEGIFVINSGVDILGNAMIKPQLK